MEKIISDELISKILKLFLLLFTLWIDAVLFYALLSNIDMIQNLKMAGFSYTFEFVFSLVIVCFIIGFNSLMLTVYKQIKKEYRYLEILLSRGRINLVASYEKNR